MSTLREWAHDLVTWARSTLDWTPLQKTVAAWALTIVSMPVSELATWAALGFTVLNIALTLRDRVWRDWRDRQRKDPP